jgi:uncharacterized protein YndB with AHSA1/START domain
MDKPLITRTFAVTCELIFNTMVNPGYVSQWLAPSGFIIVQNTLTIEPHIGGRYDYCLQDIDSGDTFWLHNKITKLVEPHHLILRSEPMSEQGFLEPIITRIELEELKGKTILKLSRQYPADRRKIAAATWNSSFDRLEHLLSTITIQ